MKNIITILFLFAVLKAQSQKVESIHFNLYTDSLKKGVYNYINVDGKQVDGGWIPLTAKEIQFTSSGCTFSGNELIVPPDYTGDKITVKAVLKTNTAIWIEKTIRLKKKPDPELPTQDEVMREFRNKPKRKRN